MNIKEILLKDYIINASDILYLLKTKTIKNLLKNISNIQITTKNKKIHTQNINHIENFIFILDQYIYYLKKNAIIDPLEIRYLTQITIDNIKNKIFLSKIYYLDNEQYYQKQFKKILEHNFKKNYRIIKKNVNNTLVINNKVNIFELINNNKNKYYILFEKIYKNNVNKTYKMWNSLIIYQ